jgi:large exoprotein involved in heme utilization and adhesion
MPNSEAGNIDEAEADGNSTTTPPKQIVEAQGWVKTPDGQVILVAEANPVIPHNPWSTSASCLIIHPSLN